MTIHIIGAGAIGLSLAYQMQKAKTNPIFLCDAQRKEKYEKEIYYLNNDPFQIQAQTAEDIDTPADFLFFAVKYHHLNEALSLAKSSIGPQTIVFSLMNGIDSEDIIKTQLSVEKIPKSFVVEIDMVKEQNQLYCTNFGKIVFGHKSEKMKDMLLKAQSFLKGVDIRCEISPSIEKALWWKFMINVGVNQTSAVLGAPYGVFKSNSYARAIMDDAMEEVIQLSKKLGIGLESTDVKHWYNVLKDLGDERKTSMLQDVEAGRKTEVEMFSGRVCALGKKYGVSTPANIMLYNMIKAWEVNQGLS